MWLAVDVPSPGGLSTASSGELFSGGGLANLGLSSGVAAEWRASSSSLRSTTATTALGGRSARGMRASASLPVLGRGSRSGSGSSAKPTTPQSIEPAVHAAQLKWMNKQERAIGSRDVD